VIEGKSIDYAESDIGCASADKMDAQCRGLGAVAAKARRLFFESSSRFGLLVEHDFFRKPVSTFRDHAPVGAWMRPPRRCRVSLHAAAEGGRPQV